MARRRARPIPRRGRPTSPRARQMQSKSPRGRAMARRSAERLRANAISRRRSGAPKNRATRPTINVADLRRKAGTLPPKNFVDTMPKVGANNPRAPRGPMSGIQLANQNAMRLKMMNEARRAMMSRPGVGAVSSMQDLLQKQQQIGGAIRGGPQEGINLANRAIALPRRGGSGRAAARAAGDPRSFMNPRQAAQFNRSRGMGNVPQRPIPNRDGRMAELQAAVERQKAAARRGFMGSLGQSNYARQPMPAQQIQRGMGRGPMARGNIGQIQAPRPTFGQQMRPSLPRRRL